MTAGAVTIIGAGRAAFHLGHALRGAQVPITAIAARDPRQAHELAHQLGTTAIGMDGPWPSASIFLLCVSDQAIAPVAQALPRTGALVVHASGASALDLLMPHEQRAILWPVMTLGAGAPMDLSAAPLIVDASTDTARAAVTALARSLSSSVTPLAQPQRELMHLAATISTNFPLLLLAKAQDLLAAEGLDPSLLLPAFSAMAANARDAGAAHALTGPARRGDIPTLHKHLARITTDHDLRRAYAVLSTMILRAHGHPTDALENLQGDPR